MSYTSLNPDYSNDGKCINCNAVCKVRKLGIAAVQSFGEVVGVCPFCHQPTLMEKQFADNILALEKKKRKGVPFWKCCLWVCLGLSPFALLITPWCTVVSWVSGLGWSNGGPELIIVIALGTLGTIYMFTKGGKDVNHVRLEDISEEQLVRLVNAYGLSPTTQGAIEARLQELREGRQRYPYPNSKGGSVVNSFKEYLNKHRELLYTLALIIVADYLLFDGAFRERIKGIVDRLLNKATGALEVPDVPQEDRTART